jgi:outer membrane receptor protein involved in Fe transport
LLLNLIESVNLGFIASPAQAAAIANAEGIDPSFGVQLNRLLFLYKNVASARTSGAELEGSVRIGDQLRASGTYAYLEAINRTTNVPLTGRSTHHGTVRLDWIPSRLGVRAHLRGTLTGPWIASIAQSAGSLVETRAAKFALWDLTVGKTVFQGADVFAAIDNLTDSRDPNAGHVSATGGALPIYRPEIGRTLRGGIRWSWER